MTANSGAIDKSVLNASAMASRFTKFLMKSWMTLKTILSKERVNPLKRGASEISSCQIRSKTLVLSCSMDPFFLGADGLMRVAGFTAMESTAEEQEQVR
jgi:hypothetical protein